MDTKDQMITLLIMTNGRRECLKRTLSTLGKLHGNFSRILIHDDSGDDDYHDWLTIHFKTLKWDATSFPKGLKTEPLKRGFEIASKQFNYELAISKRVGFRKAMISAWQKLKEDSNGWVFHLEDDFLILDNIYVNDMIDVIKRNNHIKEMVLLRQPIGNRSRERLKGGIIAAHPERYEDKTDSINYWVEHRVGFSCNPCVYNKSLIYEYPWLDLPHSEREYGRMLFKDPKAKCAYWGKSTDKPRVEHIGEVRCGFNY